MFARNGCCEGRIQVRAISDPIRLGVILSDYEDLCELADRALSPKVTFKDDFDAMKEDSRTVTTYNLTKMVVILKKYDNEVSNYFDEYRPNLFDK